MAEPKKLTEDITVNDGGGLFDYAGLIDTLIVDCNELPKALIDGQNIRFCKLVYDMAIRLKNLKDGVANDLKSRDQQIKELTELLNRGDADGMGG